MESVAHFRWAAGELLNGVQLCFDTSGEIQGLLPYPSGLERARRLPQLVERGKDQGWESVDQWPSTH